MVIWIAVALVAVVAVVAWILLYPLLSMKPAKTGEVEGTGIVAVQNGRNAVYFLGTENGFIAIDTGTDMGDLEKALAELSIDPFEVSHVLLTHSDSDHIGGLNLFANAEVYIGEDEMQLLDMGEGNAGKRSLPSGFDGERLIPLSDGQELVVGEFSIVGLKTPGHTVGSMSFLVNEAYLFTGDAFRVKGGSISLHPYTKDKEKARQTIDQLYERMNECQMVLTSHYGYYDPVGLTMD